MTDLAFDLEEVLALARHAVAATEHAVLFGVPAEGPALVWSRDDGTYLASSGLPMQPPNPDHPGTIRRVVYAHGWGPGTGADLSRTEVGDDDFVEILYLTVPDPDPASEGESLMELLEQQRQAGATTMIIEVEGSRFGIWFRTDRSPASHTPVDGGR